MKRTVSVKNFILFLILSMMILPTINVAGFGMPVMYLLSPFALLVFICVLFGWLKIPQVSKGLIVLWLVIIIQIFISTFYSTVRRLDHFVFPTDSFQYVARMIFFVSFIAFAYRGSINKNKFIKYFLIILIGGMSIGVLQWIPWPGRELFIRLYLFRDGSLQLSHLNRSLFAIRVHGLAQHATSNGGIACFAFVFAFSVRRYYGKHKRLANILIVLAILNVIISQARAGMLATAFAFVLFYVVDIKYRKRALKPTLIFSGITATVIGVIIYLYSVGNEFVVRAYSRWLTLFETSGGSRATSQPEYFFSIMETPDYILGLSKPIINRSAISYGIEVEPLNIFVTFGVIGFMLQYLLVISLLVYFYKKISKKITDSATLVLVIASFVSLFSYQVFSVAFFFFREINRGLFPWVLMGVAIGVYERGKKTGLITLNESKDIVKKE